MDSSCKAIRAERFGLDPGARERGVKAPEQQVVKRDVGTLRKRGDVYFLRYHIDGRRYEESAGTGDEREAKRVLAQRRREIREGTWTPPTKRVGAELLSVAGYLTAWIEGRRAMGVRDLSGERRHVASFVEALGKKPLGEVIRSDVKEWIASVAAKPKKTGAPRAPRTVICFYSTIATAFHDAVRDEKISRTPCTLTTRRGELPTKRDASPKWRSEAVYTRAEAEQLFSDERIPIDRRALYALQLLTGARSGEANGLTWGMYDTTTEPLGRITIAVQADGASAQRETKTLAVKEVPCHSVLASVLSTWRLEGFPLVFGWHARPSDPIVPARSSKRDAVHFRGKHTWDTLINDMERIGMRRVPSARHAMRATFLSLLEVDGAAMGIASRATHSAQGDVLRGYLRPQWTDVCREIAKLRIELRSGAKVIALPARRAASGTQNRGSDRGSEGTEQANGSESLAIVGGRDRDRTCDPLRVKQLLCH